MQTKLRAKRADHTSCGGCTWPLTLCSHDHPVNLDPRTPARSRTLLSWTLLILPDESLVRPLGLRRSRKLLFIRPFYPQTTHILPVFIAEISWIAGERDIRMRHSSPSRTVNKFNTPKKKMKLFRMMESCKKNCWPFFEMSHMYYLESLRLFRKIYPGEKVAVLDKLSKTAKNLNSPSWSDDYFYRKYRFIICIL